MDVASPPAASSSSKGRHKSKSKIGKSKKSRKEPVTGSPGPSSRANTASPDHHHHQQARATTTASGSGSRPIKPLPTTSPASRSVSNSSSAVSGLVPGPSNPQQRRKPSTTVEVKDEDDGAAMEIDGLAQEQIGVQQQEIAAAKDKKKKRKRKADEVTGVEESAVAGGVARSASPGPSGQSHGHHHALGEAGPSKHFRTNENENEDAAVAAAKSKGKDKEKKEKGKGKEKEKDRSKSKSDQHLAPQPANASQASRTPLGTIPPAPTTTSSSSSASTTHPRQAATNPKASNAKGLVPPPANAKAGSSSSASSASAAADLASYRATQALKEALQRKEDELEKLKKELEGVRREVGFKTEAMVAQQTTIDEVKEAVQCHICYEYYRAPHTINPCGHTACAPCLFSWFTSENSLVRVLRHNEQFFPFDQHASKSRKCMTCQTEVRARPAVNYVVLDLVDKIKDRLDAESVAGGNAAVGGVAQQTQVGLLEALKKTGLVAQDTAEAPAGLGWANVWEALLPEAFGRGGGWHMDVEDGVRRCDTCGHELEGAYCDTCNVAFSDLEEEMDDEMDNPLFWEGDEDEDAEEAHAAFGELANLGANYGRGRGAFFHRWAEVEAQDEMNARHALGYPLPGNHPILGGPGPMAQFAAPHRAQQQQHDLSEDDEDMDSEGYEDSFINDEEEDGDDLHHHGRNHRAGPFDLDDDLDDDEEGEEDDEIEVLGHGEPRRRQRRALVIDSEDEREFSPPYQGSDDGAASVITIDDDDAPLRPAYVGGRYRLPSYDGAAGEESDDSLMAHRPPRHDEEPENLENMFSDVESVEEQPAPGYRRRRLAVLSDDEEQEPEEFDESEGEGPVNFYRGGTFDSEEEEDQEEDSEGNYMSGSEYGEGSE